MQIGLEEVKWELFVSVSYGDDGGYIICIIKPLWLGSTKPLF